MSNATTLVLLALSAAAPPALGVAQGGLPQEVSARAEELVGSGNAEEARAFATRALAQCPGGAAGSTCRQRLRFTLGWIADRRSASAPSTGRGVLLEEAARNYSLILTEAPAHAPTLANLAGVETRLGRLDPAIDFLRRAARAEPARTAAYAVAEGDLERQAQRVDAARRAYEKAVAADPTNDTGRLRIVGLYADWKLDATGDLVKACADWEEVSLAAADAGYQAIIRRTYGPSEALAEDALVRWVSAEARLDRLSGASAAALPDGWTGAAAQDLRKFLGNPHLKEAAVGWWTSGPATGPTAALKRRHVLSQAALALGRAARSRADGKGADAIWSNALRFAPEIYEYHGPLDGVPVVRLDLVSELMLLLSDDPALDARAERFRLQETELFEGKAGAYQAGDLESIQRFHTVLGMVYARRRVWSSNERYHNAIFQLEHAISTSERRARRDGRPQAVPALRSILAEGYAGTGRVSDARSQLLLAARDNLDVDDVARAERQLRDGSTQGGSEDDARFRDQLLAVVGMRRAAQAGDQARTLAAIDPARTPALFQARTTRLDAQFLARQRFKLLAHIAETQRGKGTPLALEAAARALNTAAENSVALQGVGDLRRLEVTRAIIDTEGRILVPNVRTTPRRSTDPAEGKTLPLVIPGSAAGTNVHLDSDVVLAARVVSVIGARTVQSPDVRLRVRAGEIEVRGPADVPLDPNIVARVKGIEGVRNVVERKAQ
jgi:tetratricopeptide (TPR) repeat protein